MAKLYSQMIRTVCWVLFWWTVLTLTIFDSTPIAYMYGCSLSPRSSKCLSKIESHRWLACKNKPNECSTLLHFQSVRILTAVFSLFSTSQTKPCLASHSHSVEMLINHNFSEQNCEVDHGGFQSNSLLAACLG